MKRLLLVLMLILGAVMITSRPVATYAYTDEEKQQAKSWLSSHGYPPTRAGAEQAYQDYMDGKIDVPEADAYMGKNQKNDIEEKKNSTVNTETKKDKQSKNTNKNSTTKQENSSTEQTNNSTTSAKESTTQGTTETTTTKVTTETKRTETTKKEQKKAKKEQKETKGKKHTTGIAIGAAAVVNFCFTCSIYAKENVKKRYAEVIENSLDTTVSECYSINKLHNVFRAGCKSLPAVIAREPYMA